eukprot:8474338-Alexandrium_andersonii.AAC.1
MLGQPRVDSPTGLPERDSEAARTLGLLEPLRLLGSWRARMREPLTRETRPGELGDGVPQCGARVLAAG